MSGSPRDTDEPAGNSESFETWVREIADSKDISEEEFIEKIVSSYWVLDELSKVISEVGEDRLADSISDDENDRPRELSSTSTSRPDRTPPETRASEDELAEAIKKLSDTITDKESSSGEESVAQPSISAERIRELQSQIERMAQDIEGLESKLDMQKLSHDRSNDGSDTTGRATSSDQSETALLVRLLELVADNEGQTAQSQPLAARRHRDLKERIITVEESLSQLENELDTVPGSIQDDIDALHNRVEALESQVDTVPSPVEDDLENLQSELDELSTKVADVNAKAKESVPPSEFNQLRDALSDIQTEFSELSKRHQELDSQVSTNFSEIEDVLNHFMDEITRLDDQTESLAEQFDALTEEQTGVSRLKQLKQEANRKGITDAACEVCGESVHLPLLERAACPYCDRPASGVTERSWFFGSHSLDTDQNATQNVQAEFDSSEPQSHMQSSSEQASDNSASTPFDDSADSGNLSDNSDNNWMD